MNLIHKLRCAIDEPYRIRVGFGLSPIRNNREMRALIQFCKDQLKEEHIQKYNPKIKWVYEVTIAMWENGNARDILFNKEFNPDDHDYMDIYYFIAEHCGYYWS